ncbi:hypothetical protein HZH66_007641 [Vespula vulgaris]|uniref:Uncharacterized protein n=1 Tax=Vespula vulgaris TaxID=7454 RepID=A0A834K192_VESVU|nr:hypothetical protein HZH66_007641 [Vespula vulgaris]
MVEGDRDRYGGKSEVELEQSSLMHVKSTTNSVCDQDKRMLFGAFFARAKGGEEEADSADRGYWIDTLEQTLKRSR